MLSRTAVILPVVLFALPLASVTGEREPGLVVRVYQISHGMQQMPDLGPGQLPNAVKTIPTLELRTDRGDFAPFEGNFYTEVEGFIGVKRAGMYTFRLISDDGSMLWIDDRLVVNHDGLHGAVPKDGEIELTAGDHKLRVAHFESGGEEHLELQWHPPHAEADQFTLIPAAALTHDKEASRETSPGDKRIIPPLRRGLPGDGTPVAGMHPSLNGTQGLLMLDRSKDFDLNRYWPSLHRSGQDLHPTESFVAWLARDGEQGRYGAVIGHGGNPYAGQLIVAAPVNCEYTYTHSSILRRADTQVESKRVFTDCVRGRPQACVFRFGYISSNFELSGKMAFEMLAIRAMTNGFEIEFTKPLEPRCGWDSETYYVEQWPYDLNRWDLPARDGVRYPVKSASVSADRKRVFLEIPDLKESHVVYIRLLPPCYSEDGERPWSTEAWYTLNVIPHDRYGEVLTPPKPEP